MIYGTTSRGDIGRLAEAVGEAAAEGDATAIAVLEAASRELATFALAMERRLGSRLPIALAGGVAKLHPAIATWFNEVSRGSRNACSEPRSSRHGSASGGQTFVQ